LIPSSIPLMASLWSTSGREFLSEFIDLLLTRLDSVDGKMCRQPSRVAAAKFPQQVIYPLVNLIAALLLLTFPLIAH
jgi:hypothetical protein